MLNSDTICAIATPHGMGAIATIRVSGNKTFSVVAGLFQRNGKRLAVEDIVSHKAYYGHLININGDLLDEVVTTFFRAPHSFTGEDSAEISVHGSVYIQQKLLQVLVECGCRMAEAGEFTRRAFVNRKFDLAQAEAIADLIGSESEAAHRVAINQLKGGFSKELQVLRSKLLDMTSLMELELDFSEEDVEFADRKQLKALLKETLDKVNKLKDSFRLGNAIKNGIPVVSVLVQQAALFKQADHTGRDPSSEQISVYHAVRLFCARRKDDGTRGCVLLPGYPGSSAAGRTACQCRNGIDKAVAQKAGQEVDGVPVSA